MKKMCLLLLIISLTGCAPSYRIENQAHAVSMGIDLSGDEMTVTVQVPNLGAPQGQPGEGSSSYQIYTATAGDFESAYNILEATVPQQMNLTHLKTIVFSRAFSQTPKFYETIETFMDVFLVTGSAEVIVTEKEAKTLIENQKPHIGIRLSITIPSMLSFRAQNGYIPSCTLSSLYAGLKGRYSTSLCALSSTANGENKENSFMPGHLNRTGDNKNEYMGAAIFDRTRMVGTLNGREMQLVYFLEGSANRIADFTSPVPMRVSVRKKREVKIDITQKDTKIWIDLYLDIATLKEKEDFKLIEESLKSDLEDVISKCQKLKVEPFGFADKAAKEFVSNREYEEFDWLSRFSKAFVEVNLHINSEK